MVPSGPPTPIGGAQSILRSNFQPRTQFNSNIILNHSFQNEPMAFHQNPHHQIDPIQNFHQQMRAQVKLEPSDQQLHALRCMRNSDSSVFLQQPALQRMLQQQRGQLLQQQIHPQGKPVVYEPGTCARRLMQYMYHQQHRPDDNNIDFWRKFVSEYFAPNAKKRWCVSLYGSGRQTTGIFPQDVWQCEICNRKPGRGFETTVEVLPRLCQIKYASGTLEELLYVDMPREYQNASGQIVLDYAKAVQESVFKQLRVVRDGQLRIVFNPDLKIASWEFCARRHEELIPRRLMIPQVSYLGAVVHKYQAAAQNASSSGLSSQDLQTTCSSFVASARQLAKTLEVPQVNDLGYSKRYIRCLQISEVVNSMKDLIDYSRETGSGPMDSLINFPRRTSSSSGLQHQQSQQPEEHQPVPQNPNDNYQASLRTTSMQLADVSNGISSVNNSVNGPSPSTTSAVTVASVLPQNSTNSRQENHVGTANSPYNGGPTAQIPSASSSSSLPPSQTNPSSPFPSPTPSSTANNLTQHGAPQSHEAEPGEPQSSVQQILQEMVMSSQINGVGTLGNEMTGINGIRGMGIGGIRAAMANNINGMNRNGRMGMNQMPQDPTVLSHQQQQEMGNRLLGGIGAVNNFSGLQFDWKTSP